jgi:hypothetical protein
MDLDRERDGDMDTDRDRDGERKDDRDMDGNTDTERDTDILFSRVIRLLNSNISGNSKSNSKII